MEEKKDWKWEEFEVRGFRNQTLATVKVQMKATKKDMEKLRGFLEVLKKIGIELGFNDSDLCEEIDKLTTK